MNGLFKSTRVFIAEMLLAGITLLSVWSAFAVRRSCDRLLACTDAALASPAEQLCALRECWRAESRLLHYFVPNQPLTDLNKAILRLDALSQSQSDELHAELYAVRADLLWIREHEMTVF